jgi:hypothetical protein
MREKPTVRPKSGRANPTLVGAFVGPDPLGTGEINDCRMISVFGRFRHCPPAPVISLAPG